MTDRDIIDDIDRLVDEQMRQERSGYDHSINQAKCPHEWCDADFHGLPIKQRMQQMRNRDGSVDPEYRYNEDTSPVICPGSLFDGEFTPPASSQPNSWITAANPTWLERHGWVRDDTAPHGWRYSGEPELQFPRLRAWQINPDAVRFELHTGAPEPEPVVPLPAGTVYASGGDNGWQELGTIAPGALRFMPDTDSDGVAAWGNAAPIRTDVSRTMSVEFTVTNPGLLDTLFGHSPVLDMDTVDYLRQLQVVDLVPRAPLDDGNDDVWTYSTRRLATQFLHAVRRQFAQDNIVDERDINVRWDEQRSSDTMAALIATWRPTSSEVELHGGPSHGRNFTVDTVDRLDVIQMPRPVTIRDFRTENAAPTVLSTTKYRRAGWNTETRRWVYRNDSDWRPTCSYCRRQTVHALDDKCCQDCLRNLVITADHREGEMFVRRNGMRRAIVVSRDHHVRGIDLEMFRVHVLSWPRDDTGPYLRHRAALAGRPLESFYANTTGEQAA